MVTVSVIGSTTEQPDEAAAIMQLVTDAYRSSRAQIDRVLGRFDLSAMQYGLLIRVAQDPDISGAELARQVRVSAQAVQNQLALLEQRSLIRRTRNHGKKIKVRITPAGRQKLANAQPLVDAVQVRLVEPLDPNDRQLLRELLSVYATSAANSRDF
jgi:DNA-binding MarR family transcriptional regulator